MGVKSKGEERERERERERNVSLHEVIIPIL